MKPCVLMTLPSPETRVIQDFSDDQTRVHAY